MHELLFDFERAKIYFFPKEILLKTKAIEGILERF